MLRIHVVQKANFTLFKTQEKQVRNKASRWTRPLICVVKYCLCRAWDFIDYMSVSRSSVHPPFCFLPFGIKIINPFAHSKSQLRPRTKKKVKNPKNVQNWGEPGLWSSGLSWEVFGEAELGRGCVDNYVNVTFLVRKTKLHSQENIF